MKITFKKFIISIDLGSTNIKYLIMETSSDDFKIFAFDSLFNYNIHEVYNYIIKKYMIDKRDIEALLFTGARASFIKIDSFNDITCIIIPEFTSASYGALLLSDIEKGVIVNLGTGTSFLYSDLNTVKHLGGTGIGGGTIMSLAKIIYKINNYDELITFIDGGDYNNVDLNIGDISKDRIENMNYEITASNLGAIINNDKMYSDKDVMAGIVNMIIQNIGLLSKEIINNCKKEQNNNDLPCILIGGLLSNDVIKKYFYKIGEYVNIKYFVPKYEKYAVCIGAYEFYLLNKKNG